MQLEGISEVDTTRVAHSHPPEYSAAQQLLQSLPIHVEEGTNPRGYATRHKKGKPLPKGKLIKDMVARCSHKIGVVGPDFVGITTLLQRLRAAGYATDTLGPKPPPDLRTTFQQAHFDTMVAAWQALPDSGPALLLEDTPWAYLARHSVHMDLSTRQAAHRMLAPLTMPAFHIVLHTTGVTVGRRHPTLHTTPEQYSPHALRQMGLLAHLPSPLFHVDATASPDTLCARVQNILARRVFRVQELQAEKAEVQGMEHVSGVLQPTADECKALARQLHLTIFDATTPQGLQRLARLATIYQQNPAIVNTALDDKTRGLYF